MLCENYYVFYISDLEAIKKGAEVGEYVAFLGKLLADDEYYLLFATQCTPVATYPSTDVSNYNFNYSVI